MATAGTTNVSAVQPLVDRANASDVVDPIAVYEAIHAKHGNQHFAMVFILVVMLIGTQAGLLAWKQRHYKSFSYVSFAGLAIVPLAVAVRAHFYRFIMAWSLFALVNSWVVYRATRRPLSSRTPQQVYRWFALVYRIFHAAGMFGYALLILSFFGVLQLFFDPQKAFETGVMFAFYGLYFMVLCRDIVEVLSDRMAVTIGYYASKTGFPAKHLRKNICAVCGDFVAEPQSPVDLSTQYSPILENENLLTQDKIAVQQLSCGHAFHEQCIRGWCIIGKKDSCPYCKEKVDTKMFKVNIWNEAEIRYLQFIDWLRYLVVWQPLILLTVQGVYYIFGLE